MLRRDAGKSVSFCDGFRKRDFFHMGRGFLPLLAVMLLATPQLAFAQDSLAVTVNPRSLDIVEEGADRMYSVVLDAAPSEDVEITVVGATETVTVSPPTLTFRTTDWQDEQDVMVSAKNDLNSVDETVTLTHTATVGDDEDEVALKNVSVTVNVRDNDPRGVTVTVTLNEDGQLAVGEAASDIMYRVQLDTQPTATVTVDVGGASGELAVSPSRLFFTPGNYSTPQEVRVYAGEDFDAENDTATLTHTIRGGDYTGVSADTIPVLVGDNDMRGVTVTGSPLNIAAGARGTFTIVLDTQPTRTVSITVAEDSDDLSVSPSRLSFSTSSWNRPQTVTVRVDSDAPTGNVTLTNAVNTSSSSRDKSYDTDDPDAAVADVTVEISAPQPGVRLSPSSMTIDEGASRTYTVRLATDPMGSATVTVGGFADTDLSVVGDTTLDFTTDDYNTAQTVTVTAAEDDDAVSDSVMLTHTIAGASVTNGTLRVTVRENDTRGVTVTPPSLDINEGASGTYTVVLDSEPTGNVTVTINGASGDVTLDSRS